ncbi:protein spinster homolog 3-like [Actinia tenebrosa]|uniref:Protein spinster homolog 3-like n=1 Tax=Actinia tenebrosa TaxID=6105 RepID=A0A6P8IQ01_ACTTE|nr:protein spinster homolog 3-like [Actinia tenebrosa]
MSNERDTNSISPEEEARNNEISDMPRVAAPVFGTNCRAYLTVAVLVLINLLNYMDRFTIAGILIQIQKYFHKQDDNSLTGLLQTSFICSYMIVAPVFGYLGDRLKRKYLMAVGVLVWSLVVYSSTLLSDNHFWWFLVLRGVVGIGEASYSTIAPTVIADLFTGDMRTRMLSIFYFAIPVGSGLGYIVGSVVAAAFDEWQWGLRITPMLGSVCFLLLLFVVHEPPRGAIEKGVNPNLVSASNVHVNTSYWQDLKYIFQVKSFIWLCVGFTCVTFVTGALAFWAPKFLFYASQVQGMKETKEKVSFTFGIITCVAGIVGVWLGAEIARRWRSTNKKADALVCAIGLVACTPFLYTALVLAHTHVYIAYTAIFIGEVLLCMNWAPVGDMVLYIIVSSRRSSAEAVQILVSHLFGDAGSPWLIGQISDAIRGNNSSVADRQTSMEYSLLITTFICVLGGLAFILCAFYLEKDHNEADKSNQTDDTTSLMNSVSGDQNEDDDELIDDDDELLIRDPSVSTISSDEHLTIPVHVHNNVSKPDVVPDNVPQLV